MSRRAAFCMFTSIVVLSFALCFVACDSGDEQPQCKDGESLNNAGVCVSIEKRITPKKKVEQNKRKFSVPCKGRYCDTDKDCCSGSYCFLAKNECTADCHENADCGNLCCDLFHGRCIACEGDGDLDLELELDTRILRCPEGKDEQCDPGFFCNPMKYCEKGRCDSERPCPEYFVCTDHGRCKSDPKQTERVRAIKKQDRIRCRSQKDCKKGMICDWRRLECLPGCYDNDDCLPEAPRCDKDGICR